MFATLAEPVYRTIARYRSFVLSTHIHPDGDAIGSQLAFYSFLKDLGKQVQMVNRDPLPANFRFLPYGERITASPPPHPPEVLVVLDAGDLERIGKELVAPLRPQARTVNIDHHAHASPFGDDNLILPDACATSEILYYFFRECGPRLGLPEGKAITYERALCLYTGIMYDTGCFRYSNATPQAHEVAAQLIRHGLPVDEIYERVYENVPERKVRLLARALQTLQMTAEGQVAWIAVSQAMLTEFAASEEDLDGFINTIRAIEGVEVALLFSETQDGQVKVSFRSKGGVDVGRLAQTLGGGGHARAAGCTLTHDLDTAVSIVVRRVEEQLKP